MKKKTNAEMLKSLKQSNKVAREARAVKEGFLSSIAMIAYLHTFISSGKGDEVYVSPPVGNPSKSKTKTSSNKRPIIHVVDVLDASGSMNGEKYTAAVKGINYGVDKLREDVAEVDYTYTLCDFADEVIFRHKKETLNAAKQFNGKTRGMTALYDAIGDSVNLIKENLGSTDKVLVNIYTDGQENISRRFTRQQIASLIDDLSKNGWTFTFIGTKGDVEFAQRQLKFDISNTLVHDNTGAGLEKAFATNSVARASYSAKVESGEDVSKGFYKDIN